MLSGVTSLSLFASGFYLLVIVALSTAIAASVRNGQRSWHWRSWLGLAVLFAVLLAMRLFDIEDLLRDSFRDAMRSQETYDTRRDFQRPLAAIAVALGGLAGFLYFFRTARSISGRRNIAVAVALGGGAAMLFLVALRLISLSPVDGLLYGPLKLNWIADIGLSALVAASALYYVKIVISSRPPRGLGQ